MKKLWKAIGRFLLKKIALVLLVVALFFLVYYSKGSGHIWGVAPNGTPAEPDKKENPSPPLSEEQPVVVLMRFVNEQLELHGTVCENERTINLSLESLQQKYHPRKIIVEYRSRPDDPFVPAKEAEKKIKEKGLGFIVKKDEGKNE